MGELDVGRERLRRVAGFGYEMRRAPSTRQTLKTGATAFAACLVQGGLRAGPQLYDWATYCGFLRRCRGIRGKSVEAYLGSTKAMINDILAVSYGVP